MIYRVIIYFRQVQSDGINVRRLDGVLKSRTDEISDELIISYVDSRPEDRFNVSEVTRWEVVPRAVTQG